MEAKDLSTRCENFRSSKSDIELKEKGIEWISNMGCNFDMNMANFLVIKSASPNNINKIIKCLDMIYYDILLEETEGNNCKINKKLMDAYKAYRYISINPIIKNKIQHLDYSKIGDYNGTKIVVTEEIKMLSMKVKDLSSKLSDLCIKIDRLECDKRQPLELFELRDKYENMENEYKNAKNELRESIKK
ncbi:Hypothetical protein ORPV_396 [Orpheovirus IHUMI-LCC2]|uniref:Uncharacterized protein n=1 Tax=Orpheovirus IHUMI-LCC2 TaxID=2023057 RepID=A0A2I2L464_9VIRU|nr:Hypothetical protein ORPV_396 [Orpheovirus IHUMI-LCC2]SNW62300.1 Hypothetical protein ORPV_396 [Orpheovirus IHUMI-LCC2]